MNLIVGKSDGTIDEQDHFNKLFRADQKPQIFVDVGAYDGDTAMRALQINPNLRIVAIEPIKSLAHAIEQKFKYNRNVVVINKACWVKKDVLQFHEYNGWSKGLSTLQPFMLQLRPAQYFAQSMDDYAVEADTLDNILSDCGIDTIDYLKVDTEGAEEATLSGFTKYHSGTRFHIEHHIINLSNILMTLLEKGANIETVTVRRDPNSIGEFGIKSYVVGTVLGEF
jgi:FkbM family methyltransferase